MRGIFWAVEKSGHAINFGASAKRANRRRPLPPHMPRHDSKMTQDGNQIGRYALPLAQPITLSRGPQSHLVTLMYAPILIRDLEPVRQARRSHAGQGQMANCELAARHER